MPSVTAAPKQDAGASAPIVSNGFWSLAEPARRRVIVAGILSGLGALLCLVPVWGIVVIAEAALAAGNTSTAEVASGLWSGIAIVVVGVVAGHLATRLAYTVSHFADVDLARTLRQRLLDTVLRTPLDALTRLGSGRVKKLLQDDIAKLHQFVAHAIPDTVDGIVRPLASVTLLFALDWRVGLVALIPLVLAFAFSPLFMRDLATQFDRYNAALAGLGSATVEFVRGIEPIKVFDAHRGRGRYQRSVEEHHRFYDAWMNASVVGQALVTTFISPVFAVTVAIVSTGLLVLTTDTAPAMLLAAAILSVNITGPLYLLMHMAVFLREARGAVSALTDFIGSAPAVPTPSGVAPADSSVKLRDVDYVYDNGTCALQGVDLQLPPGSVTALVGRSGSGKSTLASLLPRLRDASSGSVRLGGSDVADVADAVLYRHVGFVLQDPLLLRVSVRENILLSRPDCDDETMIAAARAAQIHERIMALPGGYDAIVGDDARLSGGERQRVSIARAIVQDPQVLVLDEATLFADPDSEWEIQHALAEIAQGRALVVIAHRLHTIVDADTIVVLEDGRIVEQGSHDDLVASEGRYARAWQSYQRAADPLGRTHTQEVSA